MLCPQENLKNAGDIQQATLKSCQAIFNCSPALAQLAAAAAPAPTHTKLLQKLLMLQQANTSTTTSPLQDVGSRRGALNIASTQRAGGYGVRIQVQGRDFSRLANVQTGFGAHPASNWYRGLALGVKCLGCRVNRSLPPSVEVKNECSPHMPY
jgi:hypothetical protein